MRFIATAAIPIAALFVACGPGVGEISGATDAELDKACAVLERVGYDYWQVGISDLRIMEVAADIHTAHPGPEKAQKYCEGR